VLWHQHVHGSSPRANIAEEPTTAKRHVHARCCGREMWGLFVIGRYAQESVSSHRQRGKTVFPLQALGVAPSFGSAAFATMSVFIILDVTRAIGVGVAATRGMLPWPGRPPPAALARCILLSVRRSGGAIGSSRGVDSARRCGDGCSPAPPASLASCYRSGPRFRVDGDSRDGLTLMYLMVSVAGVRDCASGEPRQVARRRLPGVLVSPERCSPLYEAASPLDTVHGPGRLDPADPLVVGRDRTAVASPLSMSEADRTQPPQLAVPAAPRARPTLHSEDP